MQYKINQPIYVRYLELDKEEGLTDLLLTPTNSSGVDQTPITFSDLGDGLYQASFTPNSTGWWQVRVSCVTKPRNVYSKSYFVGTEFTTYPPQEDGKLTSLDTKMGEVQASPTTNTLLGRLKDLWDKLNTLFTDGLAKIKIWDGTETVNVTTDNKLETITHGRAKCSTLNSTLTLLDVGETFTGTWEEILDYSMLCILILSDQDSATDGLVIEWSCDGSVVEQDDKFSILANNGKTFSFGMIGKYFRVKYTNGSVAQSLFRLQSLLKPFNQKASSHRINDSIVGEDDAELVKAILTGKSDSQFINVRVTSLGRLEVENIPSNYITKSLSEITDIPIPQNTDYWVLNLSNTVGVIDEFHIVTDSDKFMFKIEVDGINYFDETGVNIETQYRLGSPGLLATATSVKNIESTDGKDLHWILPINFNSSIKIGVRNNTENNKKLKGYIILYKIR